MDNNGWVIKVTLPEPTLSDNTADSDRLAVGIKQKLNSDLDVYIDHNLLGKIPGILRECAFEILCILFRDKQGIILIDIIPDSEEKLVSGIAIDLGTTIIVVRLIDLLSGNSIDEISFENPQKKFGTDILTRIHYASDNKGLREINGILIDSINREVMSLCIRNNIGNEKIYLSTIAGNTAMTHLFLGITPYWLIREPYIPATNSPGLIKSVDVGLELNPFARIYVFPNIGSYFGGDLISGILFLDIHKRDEVSILVDVGTNAEVVVGNKNWMIACAGAAGPALESGLSDIGMAAENGVIDRFYINDDVSEINYHTIGEEIPKGICGSGFIDLASVLFKLGFIDVRGKINSKKSGDKLRTVNENYAICLVSANDTIHREEIIIDQPAIDSLIRSKAAMYTILETITDSVDISFTDIASFYVAGTFGYYIKPDSAISIGMLPDIPTERYTAVGNSSLGGASKILASRDCFEEIDEIRKSVTYLELNVNHDFMTRFSAAKFIPHTDPDLFPSVTA